METISGSENPLPPSALLSVGSSQEQTQHRYYYNAHREDRMNHLNVPTSNPAQVAHFERYRMVRRNIAEEPSLGCDVITVVVGPPGSTQTFIVQESLLCSSSSFFNNCLSRPCKEQSERVVKLASFNPETFKTYAQFLNTGLLFIMQGGDAFAIMPSGTPTLSNKELGRCMRIYKMADYLQDPNFKDAIVDAIIEIMAELHSTRAEDRLFLTHDCVRFLYNYSAKTSPIRKLIVDWAVKVLDHSDFEAARKFGEQDAFISDVSKALGPVVLGQKTLAQCPDPFEMEMRCRYHEHTVVGKPCYKYKYGR